MQNIFFESGFPADDAAVLALKSDIARAIREATAGMSQSDVADKLQVDRSCISRIHRGELDALSLERLIKLTVRLGLNVGAQWGKGPHTALAAIPRPPA